MLRVADPYGKEIAPAVPTGFSMLRYGGFAALPGLTAVRARLENERAPSRNDDRVRARAPCARPAARLTDVSTSRTTLIPCVVPG